MKPVLALLALLLGLATVGYLWREQASQEIAAYQAVLRYFSAELVNSPLTLMSRPTSCGLRLTTLTDQDEALFAAFKQANVLSDPPLLIDSLSDHVNVVSLDDAKRLKNSDRNENDLGIQIMHLSRVGFAHDSESALLCLESDYSGMAFVLLFTGVEWKVKETIHIWSM